ncbi:MAG: hypothetical protein JSR52_02785 [Planctomycetes bacterium]|nr:hypothetical protein [Planctomycetota bacterium]
MQSPKGLHLLAASLAPGVAGAAAWLSGATSFATCVVSLGAGLVIAGALRLSKSAAAKPASPAPHSPATEPVARVPDSASLAWALDADADLILLLKAGVVRWANGSATAFFGGQALAGRAIEDLFVQPEILDEFRSATAGRPRAAEVVLTGRQGRRNFRLTTEARTNEGLVLMHFRDITDEQSALRLGGDFVASVSHEMRTPLASIKGALETLEGSASDDPAMKQRLLQMIATNAARLEALTADVLRLSQLETAGTPAEIGVLETMPILDSIASLLDPMLGERGLRLEFDIEEGLSTIRTDQRLFELIFKNLVENSAKFAFEQSVIRLQGRRLGDSTVWRVIDKGIGIPLDQQARIFDRFFQVDPSRTGPPKRRGTGLGLAIVQNAVRALGGSIRVESVWQQGTTMIVELPESVPAG